jgi:Zn-dependent protease with chaperone function
MSVKPPHTCPNCANVIEAADNFPVWCVQCEWGLGDDETSSAGSVRGRLDRRSARMVETLYEEVSGKEIHRPGWDLARVVSYLLALAVHAFTVSLLLVAALLMWKARNLFTILIMLVLVLTAFAIGPRLGRIPKKNGDVRFREDSPALFGLLDRIGAEMDARPVDAVVVSPTFNAAYGVVGLRRRRVLEIGLPLWDTLSGQQRVALIAHELAHGVNGDSRHGLIVGTSLSSLSRLHSAVLPGGGDARVNYLIDLIARAIQGVAAWLIGLIFRLQKMITLRAGQRAEYLADRLAARVASPAAVQGMLDTLLTREDSHITVVRRQALPRTVAFWDDHRQGIATLPELERERRRRMAARRRLRVDESHPPTHLRIGALNGRPDGEPRIRLESAEQDRIQVELGPDYDRVAKDLREAARAALYR